MGTLLEIELEYGGTWAPVDPIIFRSWTGRRRIQGREYHGVVYLFTTDTLARPSQARACICCAGLQLAAVPALPTHEHHWSPVTARCF